MRKNLLNVFKTNRSIVNNIMGSFFIKGGAIVVTLMTTPAYIRYFEDQTVLGLWFTLLSVLMWVLSFDLGIGNGLRNKLTVVLASKDLKKAKQYISSSYIILGSLAIALSTLSFLVFPFINWNNIFNVSKETVDAMLLVKCVEIVFCGLMLQFALNLVSSILYALQKSALNNFLSLISSLIILLYVLYAPNRGMEVNLIALCFVNVLSVNIPLFITTIIVFSKELRDSRPSFKAYSKSCAKAVLGVGLTFFVLQFMSMMIGNTNEFLISKFTSPENVVDYQVYSKIFNVFNSVFNLALIPIWSEATKQLARNKLSWIKKMHKLLMICSVFATLLLFAIVPFFQTIVNIWLGSSKNITVIWQYGVCFAISTSLMIWHGSNCTIANGLSWLKAQSIFLTIGAIINVPLAYIFAKCTGMWIAIIVANIISLIPVCIAQPIYIQKKLRIEERGQC